MLKPTIIWLLILSMITASCSKNPTDSQGTLTGVVTREGQEDHGSIVVQLRELGQRTTTSAAGSYSFSSVPPGTYTLLAADGDTARHLFDFVISEEVSVTAGRSTVAPNMELPLFHRVENDLTGQVRWTAQEGPYLITRSVTVQSGSQLTVEPGTMIKFEGYHRLTVLGRLLARGSVSDSISFTSMKVDGAPGDWDRISIPGPGEGLSDTISYCQIKYANIGVTCSQSEPVIRENSICHCSGYGLVTTASTPEICGNLLRDNYGGISCENGTVGIVQANIIEENTSAGIACGSSSPLICDNIIAYNQRGLQAQSESNPLVWHNRFFSNEDAVYLFYYCDPQIDANEISEHSRYAFYLLGYNRPQIHFNNITQNGSYLVSCKDQPYDVQAQNNWWGTSNPNEISSLIWDGQDDSRLGNVMLDPILEAPVDSAGPRISP